MVSDCCDSRANVREWTRKTVACCPSKTRAVEVEVEYLFAFELCFIRNETQLAACSLGDVTRFRPGD